MIHHKKHKKTKNTNEYLFVYGTLIPELAPAEIEGVVRRLGRVGPGFTRGLLYDLGEHPVADFDDGSDGRIFGEVLELPDDASVIDALDRYEGFDREDEAASWFVRTKCHVILESGDETECWVYVYNGEIASAKFIESGDYLGYRSHR
jgi:gamma-glutamylcyclotransferase (GGCT)/AIG2-like uncharacterized protein YtfP